MGMNDAVTFIKNKLTAPIPPNAGLSEEQIYEQQQQTYEKLEKLKRKKKEEEEDEDSDYRASRIEDEDEDYQTPAPKPERETEPQEKAQSRFMMKVKDVVNRVDDVIDETADKLEERAGIAYQNAKAGTKKFLNDERIEFQKATQQRSRSTPQRKRTYKPLVSESDKARSADFAVRDYERRRQPRQYPTQNIISERGYQAVDDMRTNPYIGFNDVNGYGELSRDAFSLSTSQFNFSLIGDSSSFGGAQQQAKNQFSISFGGSFLPTVDSGFGGVYRGEFDAFKKPKNPHKRKNKRRKSPHDFDISRLIF